MDNVTPWALCIGIFLIYPALAFVAGFYLGKRGLPFSVEIRRKPGLDRPSLADDGYGVATDT
jgi:hypothetical protein